MVRSIYKDKQAPAPSDEFWDAVCDGGTCYIACELCGRTHFNDEVKHSDYEKGTHEYLLEKAEEDPDRFINHGDYSVGFGELDDLTVVAYCPCNLAFQYEHFIWIHKYIIANYLEKKSEILKAEAKRNEEASNQISKALEGDQKQND